MSKPQRLDFQTPDKNGDTPPLQYAGHTYRHAQTGVVYSLQGFTFDEANRVWLVNFTRPGSVVRITFALRLLSTGLLDRID